MKKLYDKEVTEPFQSRQERKNWVLNSKKKLSKIVEADYLPKMPDFDPALAIEHMAEIEKFLQCRIYCWRKQTVLSKWKCCRYSPYQKEYETSVDIVLEYDECGMSLMDVGVILEIDYILPEDIRYQRTEWTIFEAAVLFKKPQLKSSVKELRKEVQDLEKIWGRGTVHVSDAKEFWQKFGLSLQVWKVKRTEYNRVKRIKKFDYPRFPNLIGKG